MEVRDNTPTIGRLEFIASEDITITGLVPDCSESLTGSSSAQNIFHWYSDIRTLHIYQSVINSAVSLSEVLKSSIDSFVSFRNNGSLDAVSISFFNASLLIFAV